MRTIVIQLTGQYWSASSTKLLFTFTQIVTGSCLPKFCPNCGTEIVYDQAKFCPDCGYSLTIETQKGEITDFETKIESTYPLPDDVQNCVKPLRGNQINFQTSLSLEQIIL